MEKFMIDLKEDLPKYLQIVQHIKKLIDMNALLEGEKLPSIRVLSEFLHVNNDTIINSYNKLRSEGYAVLKMGSGTYVKKKEGNKRIRKEYSNTIKALSKEVHNEFIDFSGENSCNEFFPITSFKNVINEVLDRDGVKALSYQEEAGYDGLRRSINNFFWNGTNIEEEILIVSGAQQGIDVASKALININDNVIVERPTYSGALSVFNMRRANVFDVQMDTDGININEFEKILKKYKIKCFYAMSYFQNPTGSTYSLEKKMKIIELANKYDFYIIEDDYLSELIYDLNIEYKSFKNLDKYDRVIYIKSFSKIFLPGIRIGYMIIPKLLKEQIENCKVDTDISTSSLMQRALELYINKGYWKEYIQNLNIFYKERYNNLMRYGHEILKDSAEISFPGGGLNVYIKIKDEININCLQLFYECKKDKVLITPGVLFYKNAYEGLKYFRIGFSQVDTNEIITGLSIIKNKLNLKNL